ncbi:hypothetical protein BN1708_006260 [Verticillium longisporum]|uniref:S-formylglutathione hydrolase n=2 Tax=Verticillium longisporum TaxID=100787 RepID=A0A0G4MIZ1_VERLO|nr:hypothetical protein BN1708_006260 [Verticillium longisporum]
MTDVIAMMGVGLPVTRVVTGSFARLYRVYRRNGVITTLLFTVLPDTSSTLDRIETILSGTESEISEYRKSLSSNMNMAAVAGAIVAQLAITGLSLEARSQAHWTASAFLTASIAFGVISVYVSFIVQQELNGLLGSTGVADWLSVPLTQAELQAKADQLYRDPALDDTELSVPLEREVQPENGAGRPGLTREASALAAILLSAPSGLLVLSLNAFVIGLARPTHPRAKHPRRITSKMSDMGDDHDMGAHEDAFDDDEAFDYDEFPEENEKKDDEEDGEDNIINAGDPSAAAAAIKNSTLSHKDMKIPDDQRTTTPYMTKYEKARILGTRALQISMNAPVLVDLEGEADPLQIAIKELREKKIPLIVRRYMPDGYYEDWTCEELLQSSRATESQSTAIVTRLLSATAIMAFTTKATIASFGGQLLKLSHASSTTKTDMALNLYLPPSSSKSPVPLLIYLSGLTCTPDNATEKSFIQSTAAARGIAVLLPDTSPRGLDIAGANDAYDFGEAASFYIDAQKAPYADNYKMETYLVRELPALLEKDFADRIDFKRVSITGHSMGGHGALTLYLKHPGLYKSVSAFAPIANPSRCPWGEKAFKGYLGDDEWKKHDATELVKGWKGPLNALIDVGTGDNFYKQGQLLPENFEAAVKEAGLSGLELRYQKDYDHSYFFMASFQHDHVNHAAKFLGV